MKTAPDKGAPLGGAVEQSETEGGTAARKASAGGAPTGPAGHLPQRGRLFGGQDFERHGGGGADMKKRITGVLAAGLLLFGNEMASWLALLVLAALGLGWLIRATAEGGFFT